MIQNVPYPKDFTPHSEKEWTEIILGPWPKYRLCPQCSKMTNVNDFDPRAGMCGVCINEAMAEMDTILVQRGLVASAEEHEAND